MTSKKKLDEAVTLTMNSLQSEIQMNSTVQADDLVELALLLKNSGIVADDFQGPATLTSDEQGISTTVNAVNLRAIMNMLEPVFQMAGDMEADMVGPECDQVIDTEMDSVEVEPEMDIVSVEPEMAPQDELDENQDDDAFDVLDWITTKEVKYASEGSEDYEIQNKTVVFSWVCLPDDFAGHEIPEEIKARLVTLGDMDFGSDMEDFGIYTNPDNDVKVAYAWYYLGGMNEDAEYDYRTHDVHPREYPAHASKEIVQPDTKIVPARSGDNPLDEASKTFMDYVKEAELNELSKAAIVRYSKAVNDQGENLDDKTAMKRGRGLSNAHNKIHWKDANVLATESTYESLMAELNKELGEDLALKKMGNHEITFSDPADDEIEDLENDSPEKLQKVVKDISQDMHEDGEMSPRPTDFNSVAKRARDASKEGFVQHVNRHEDGQHSVSDWMSDDTVASFSHGRNIGGQDIDEEALDEISQTTKDSYINKAADQVRRHMNYGANHKALGNQEMADEHDALAVKRLAGIKSAVKEDDAPRYEIGGSMSNYYIRDNQTGEVVADDIRSGHEAHNMLYWFNNEKNHEVDEARRGSPQWMNDMDRRQTQYGEPFFMNTDCGFASLQDINAGNDYFYGNGGFTVLEIDRNGKTGLNYLSGIGSQAPAGTNVTCITQGGSGQKYRPGKVLMTVTDKELVSDYQGVVDKLAGLGISPTKKLSVKTFD